MEMHLLLWISWTLLISVDCAKILCLFPYNARSHFIVMEPLLHALHQRGHNLTVVSSFPQQKRLENFRDVDLSVDLPSAVSSYTLDSIREFMPNRFVTPIFIAKIHMDVCEKVLKDERILNLLNEPFDLVIGEIFGADCFSYIAYKLGVPQIAWVTSASLPWSSDRVGLPDNPSYIPNYFVDYPAEMNFWQRLYNSITLMWSKTVYHFYSDIPSHRLAEKVFNCSLPPMDEINRQTALILLNSHYTLAQSRPFPPNVVEVGGIHVREPKALPEDIRRILDDAKQGVILFSFGSLVRASSLPPRTIQMFLNVFRTLPQVVVFKYEDSLDNLPPNVVVRKWLPQSNIAAHPNVRAIITHCGLASTVESVHFAKPLIGVPFFSDQYQNAKNVARRGAGIVLNIDNLREEDIASALKAVLQDPSFAENMQKLSWKFHDRPMTPLQTAVYWTEYVIRHQGAPHLRPASVHLAWYQLLLLDIVVVLATTMSAVVVALYCVVRTCTSLMRTTRKTARIENGTKKENGMKKPKARKTKKID
ncbi:UDP-glucosyltransferase 2-like isoform X2 [Macrosteles quadrilineatus]|uniref:UDP-glucosyltransferase 2-like isoform X2 n=1 Tax=Macrosteles quadrilineatus TaxID=74068 RepID=UPI0023E1889B|nr:UDP-glucosyltransferase 2-like isoform X2 [Macrosteles quadrilineatus]